MAMTWFEGFAAQRVAVSGAELFVRTGGRSESPALLLLHGYPQTHAIWQRVAQRLADRFFLVLPDLRGYGQSSKPAGAADQASYSKRAMARDMLELMAQLGHREFFVCGHDRGGRVAHRLALDHPAAVRKLCVIDIAPTLDMYEATDLRFARAYYHWFFLIQPAPLPERLIAGDPRFYLHSILGASRAQGLGYIEPEALADYERGFCTPEGIHATCEDYRASATLDLDHDRASRAAGDKIACDVLVLWGEHGVIHRLFKPLELWRAACAGSVSGATVPTGHFIPEEEPERVARELGEFFE
jgi:haloacetate dehalogenase